MTSEGEQRTRQYIRLYPYCNIHSWLLIEYSKIYTHTCYRLASCIMLYGYTGYSRIIGHKL